MLLTPLIVTQFKYFFQYYTLYIQKALAANTLQTRISKLINKMKQQNGHGILDMHHLYCINFNLNCVHVGACA